MNTYTKEINGIKYTIKVDDMLLLSITSIMESNI